MGPTVLSTSLGTTFFFFFYLLITFLFCLTISYQKPLVKIEMVYYCIYVGNINLEIRSRKNHFVFLNPVQEQETN